MSRCANPKRIIAVNEQAGNIIDRRGDGENFSAAQRKQTAAFRPNPQISRRVIGERTNGIFRQTIAGGKKIPLRSVVTTEAVLAANPKFSVATLKERVDLQADICRRNNIRKIAGGETEQALVTRASPDLLPAVHQHRPSIAFAADPEIGRGIGK